MFIDGDAIELATFLIQMYRGFMLVANRREKKFSLFEIYSNSLKIGFSKALKAIFSLLETYSSGEKLVRLRTLPALFISIKFII